MKSDVIFVDSLGTGFRQAVSETKKVAVYMDLAASDAKRLELITEEMLSLVRMVTGENAMSFWIECDKGLFQLHLSTETVMDATKRTQLLSSASNRQNEAARSLLGKLRDKFEQAMLLEPDHADLVPQDVVQDLMYHPQEDPEWDRYERSVLRRITDDIRIGIRGNKVEMTVSKRFA